MPSMAAAACFWLPSRQEGFSIAVLEELAFGVPAVLSAACHFREVEEAGAGRVVALEARAITSALVEVVASGWAMREKGSSLVQSHCLWGNIAAAMLDRYTRALAGARVAPPSEARVPGGNVTVRDSSC
jgi:glycosyltransferase involved in cell wall biosynthesis